MVRCGWIGSGVMGQWMCRHLLAGGHPAAVYSRTLSKCNVLVDRGAQLCISPREVAEQSDIVFTMVGYPSDVEEVILGGNGVLEGLRSGGTIVDMTTSQPALAVSIYNKCKAKGVDSLDAPVSGGDIGAMEARLSIMAGGNPATFEKVYPLFKLMGKNIHYMGDAGTGQHTKMVNQILIATNMIGVVEGLVYGYRAGLDLERVLAAVGSGAAGSWSVNNLGPRIVQRNFDPGFFVQHFVKDLKIALDEAKEMNLSLPGLALANQLYLAVVAQGHARLGTHALVLALETLNNIDMSKE